MPQKSCIEIYIFYNTLYINLKTIAESIVWAFHQGIYMYKKKREEVCHKKSGNWNWLTTLKWPMGFYNNKINSDRSVDSVRFRWWWCRLLLLLLFLFLLLVFDCVFTWIPIKFTTLISYQFLLWCSIKHLFRTHARTCTLAIYEFLAGICVSIYRACVFHYFLSFFYSFSSI